jgi:C4-dicarboxylate-binding protein DctP
MHRRQVLAALAAPLLLRPAAAQPPYVLKFSHLARAESPKGQAAERFARIANERSGGRLRVQVFPEGQLVKDREELEALQLGAVHMLAPSLAKLGLLGLTDMALFDLPFLFDDLAAVARITQGPLGRHMLAGFAARGFVGLGYWDGGLKQMCARRALRRPADYEGLQIGTAPSQVLDAQMRALGASAVPMGLPDAFEGMRSGLVDGVECVPADLRALRAQTGATHLMLSGHGYQGAAVIVNKAFWDELPADLRTLLQSAVLEASAFGNELAHRTNEAALAAMQRGGVTAVLTLSAAERTALRRALLPVHRQMEARIGSELLRRAYRTLDFELGS